MCGRYEFKLNDSESSKKIKAKIIELNLTFKEGEIFPSDKVLCVIPISNNKVSLDSKTWGIKLKSLLINARIESLNEKETYKKIFNNRCAIISNGFYEWKDKQKYYISFEKDHMYMPCLYDCNNDLVIITEGSNSNFKMIHERCPIIMNKNEMLNYLFNGDLSHSEKQFNIKIV